MDQLFVSLQEFIAAGWHVIISLLAVLLPWSPFIAWVGFWLLAVNWEKLYPVLAKGGIIGVAFIGLMMILVWGLIAPPPTGSHQILGLSTSNFVGKTFYVTMLLSIAAGCGSVQLSGACGSLCGFPDEAPDEHGHDSDDHGQDSHGHGHDTHHLGH